MFFKQKTTRYIFVISLLLFILYPILNIFYIYPQFTSLLIKNTEDGALKLGEHLASMYFKKGGPATKETFIVDKDMVKAHVKHFGIMKIKIFSPDGEVIFSTDEKDIGKINKADYFWNIVAKGRPFTKVIKKGKKTMEGQDVTIDVVEVYVPLMRDGKFGGAFEIYYDITASSNALKGLIQRTSFIPIGIFVIFLSVITILLKMHDRSITKIKMAEKELKSYAQRLEKSNRELQDFAYIASHDLQEPLRKVIAFGDRLMQKYSNILDERGRDYLKRMHTAAHRMQSLIQGLLNFSRVTTKARPFEPVDLNSVVREVLSDLEERINETGARIETGNLHTVDADPLQMRQLFQNLISNALKFSKKDVPPEIRIYGSMGENGDSGTSDQAYRIVVEDNGIGFDQKYADRIFGVFQRLHGKQEYDGTGIGLSICKKIVERHGGSIQAEGIPGKGAKFIITMPLRHDNGGGDGRHCKTHNNSNG